MFDFSGQIVVISGATRGIGKSIAESFLHSGARIVGIYHANQAAAGQFLDENRQFSPSIDLQSMDVADYGQVEKFYHYLEARYQSFQVLVNNAGIRKDAVLGMMKESDWKAVIEVNLSGAYHMCKFAVRNFMNQQYGRIINITSPSGKFGFAGQANYAASKAGLVALTRVLSKEVATRGITVNCVSPGFIDTEFIQDLSEERRRAYREEIPLKRFGTPREVAQAVLFLASKEASYITGATLEVTGGL
ncbi:MAG: 3-oxoacyl-ACP reductase FabG [bacterium]